MLMIRSRSDMNPERIFAGKAKVGDSGPRPPDSPDVPDSERRPISRIGVPEHDT